MLRPEHRPNVSALKHAHLHGVPDLRWFGGERRLIRRAHGRTVLFQSLFV
nr:MAG TPA: hypothetical protein [Caudoviricetes sp.]